MSTLATTQPMPSRRSKILRGLAYFAAFVLALVLLVYAFNCRDEALGPEVAALLKAPAYRVAERDNGFFLASALQVPSEQDALATAAARFQTEERRFYANPSAWRPGASTYAPGGLELPKWSWGNCLERAGSCLDDLFAQRATYQSALAAGEVLLQRYRQLQQMSGFEEHSIPVWTFVPEAFHQISRASGMNVASAALEIADGRLQQGMERLEGNSRFLHRLMGSTTTLIGRMSAVRMLTLQTRVLSELMARYPQLVEQHGAALARALRPLGRDEQDFMAVIQNEARYGCYMLFSLGQEPAGGVFMRGLEAATAPFVQKNVLCNMLYDSYRPMIAGAHLLPAQYAHLRQSSAAERAKQLDASNFPYVNFVSRSLGKILVGMTPPDAFFSYMEKSADLDGYLRLVSLQLALAQNRIVEAEIPAFIERAGPELRDPYDGRPMRWNAQARQLEFSGREGTARNAAKIFSATVPRAGA